MCQYLSISEFSNDNGKPQIKYLSGRSDKVSKYFLDAEITTPYIIMANPPATNSAGSFLAHE